MPKMPEVSKMPKVEVFYRFYLTKKQGRRLHSLADARFLMQKIPGVYNIDGAKPPARRGCRAYASESDTTILGNLGILAHFRHFPVYPD
jgi:hypothetical protein